MYGQNQNDNDSWDYSNIPSGFNDQYSGGFSDQYGGGFNDQYGGAVNDQYGGGNSDQNTYPRPNAQYAPVGYLPQQGPPSNFGYYSSGLQFGSSGSSFVPSPGWNASHNGYPPQEWRDGYEGYSQQSMTREGLPSVSRDAPPPELRKSHRQQVVNPLALWDGVSSAPSAIWSLYQFGVDEGLLDPLSKTGATDTAGAESNVETEPPTEVESKDEDEERKRNESRKSKG